jgi:hypothetical protein
MTIQLSSLRVAPEADSSRFVPTMNQMRDAAGQMGAAVKRAGADVAQAIAATDGKIMTGGDSLARLSRQYVEGYATQQRFATGLGHLNRALETGKVNIEGASAILVGMNAKLGLAANSSEIAAKGQTHLAAAVKLANSQIEQQTIVAGRAIAVNDNAARFRKQVLGYQAFDVGQGLAMGAPLTMIAAQQGPQIAQLYAAQGGLNALWKDATGILGGLARAAGPWIAAAGALYGAYRYLMSNSAAAALAIDKTTEALAAQAAPVGSLKGMIGDLANLQGEYRKALSATGDVSTSITDTIIANTQREFDAKKSLLELELKRQDASLKAQQAALAVEGLGLRKEVGQQVFTRADLERQGYADPRIGSVPFVRLPDDVTGLDKTWAAMENSPINDKIKELRANLTLSEIATNQLRDALKATFNDGSLITGAGKLANAIPIPQFRGIDDVPGDQDFMRDFNRQSDARVQQMQQEIAAIGLSGKALSSYRFEMEAMNSAIAKNIDLNPEQLSVIRKQAQEYGRLADEIARANLNRDLKFEREQLFRSPLEQQIASRLRGSGLGMDSSEANQMREIQRITDLRAGVKGFFDDFESGLLRGDDLGKSLGNAILNALNKSLDKIIESGIDALVNALVGGKGSSGGGGILESLLGDIFSSGKGGGDPWGGLRNVTANDNYSPGAITRAALPNIGSITSSIGGSYNVANATSFIQQYASAIGIDPSVALRVARSEGLGAGIWQSNLFKNGVREPSFGPFQLLKGGQGTGFGAGLGNKFMEQTGLDPANPGNWRQSTAFALDQAKSNGWGAWYGAKNSGIGTWEGIDKSASKAVGALDKLTSGSGKAVSGIANLGQAGNQATQGLSSFASNLNKFPAAPMGGMGGGGIGGAPTGLNGLLGFFLGGATGWGKAGDWLSANPGQFTGLWAHGGVFDRGISDYSNSIVDRPTFFKFASGSGLMGEAGPEAIMPLRRGSDGKLGVSMHGGGGGVVVNMTVEDHAGVRVRTEQTRRDDGTVDIRAVIEQVAAESLTQRGRPLNMAMQGRFGQQPALKKR